MKRLFSAFIAIALTGTYGAVLPSGATPITFTGSSGSLAASATFEASGTNLIVTLTNTSTADVTVPADVLTGLFFTLAGDPALTRVSAILNTGSTVLFGTTDPGNVVGGEWAYVDGLSGAPAGADEGISSSGLGLFGPGVRFLGTNLQGPTSPDGLQYGITSAGDNSVTGNEPVTGSNALIKNSVVFTLSGIVDFDPSATNAITKVSFQYGTDLSEPNVPGGNGGGGGGGGNVIPEPGTFLLLGSGLVGLAIYGRRKLGR